MDFRRELTEQMRRLRYAEPSLDVRHVTRFEVIDEHGRVYGANPARVTVSVQDAGRTLKVFVHR